MKTIIKMIGAVVAIAACAGAAAFISERKKEQQLKVNEKLVHKPNGFYEQYVKRPLDCFLAAGALISLSPVLLALTVVGAVEMHGNPFFTQDRPGKDEKIFKLIKFRTMSNQRDENGKLLPDDVRLNKYGRFLRSTSLDELPELFNILTGDMAIVGPRPLLPEYLPYYKENERLRHCVRPGLTGLAQVNGRNAIHSWEERFAYDIEYVRKCSLMMDVKILLKTVLKVVKRSDILVGNEIAAGRLDDARREAEHESNTEKI